MKERKLCPFSYRSLQKEAAGDRKRGVNGLESKDSMAACMEKHWSVTGGQSDFFQYKFL